jgi:hypothetical protein
MNENIGQLVLLVTGSLVVGLILFLVAGIHLSSIGEGEHSGYITAIDQNGYIFRNYDVYFKTDNSSSQEDMYCINRDNRGLIEKAKEANKSRKQVTIRYHGVRAFGLDLCKDVEIDNIE